MPTFDPDFLLHSLCASGLRLCFYPSCGQRVLWSVMGLEAGVFVFSDCRARTRQGRQRFWQGIAEDFRRHGEPLQLVKATVRTRVFRCGEKWGFLFFQDNNEVLARIQASQCQITSFVGICDGCREGGNYECVHSPPFLDKLLAAAAMPLTYFADHSELLSYWRSQVGHFFFHRQVVHQQRWMFTLQDVLVRPHCAPGEAPDAVPEVDMDVGVYALVPDPALRAVMKQKLADGQAGASPLMTLAPFRRGGQSKIIARYEVTVLEKPHPDLNSPPITTTLPTAKPPTAMQQHDSYSKLWSADTGPFFRDRFFVPRQQEGPHCVSTVLSMLTGQEPGEIRPGINTQDPVSWSDYLRRHGMKLAFCPTDCRRLRHYLDDLLALDDLFTLSYYSPTEPEAICADPNERGWVCGSHIVLLHRNKILDPASGTRTPALAHHGMNRFTKRIFRVVPSNHARGL